MTALSEEKVLRINCPGFGVSSTLPLGEAKPLAMYDVIIINPTSAVHLFNETSDSIKQIELLQQDGMTSYLAQDDSHVDSITAEMDIRAQELTQFLKKGGLLVYFLAPPFTVSGPGQSLDNYGWLGEWAPDKPTQPNQRNMSATIRGKAIETSADAAQAIWVPYLKQNGMEWSTIIRLENLTEGYVPLATAGPNKCVAGFKSSGPKAGQVVFLPAPYDQKFDGKLKECVERWFAIHCDDAAASTGLQNLSKGLSSLLSDEAEAPAAAAEAPAAPAAPEPATPAPSSPAAKNGKKAAASSPPAANTEEIPAFSEAKAAEEAPQFFDDAKPATASEPLPEAQDLIKKMQQEISKPAVPDWCSKFSFEELDGLRQELSDVNEEIRLAQQRAQHLHERIERMEDLKNALLSAQGEVLIQACTRVFESLGWEVKPALGSTEELWLVEDNKTQAIVRLIHCQEQPNRSELAALAESVITYWGAHEVEPKGIFVASTFATKPPQDRPDDDFGEAMNEFAKRKNLALATTAQLLSIFRDLDVSDADPKTIRENLLTTSGRVTDYVFNKKGTTAARS